MPAAGWKFCNIAGAFMPPQTSEASTVAPTASSSAARSRRSATPPPREELRDSLLSPLAPGLAVVDVGMAERGRQEAARAAARGLAAAARRRNKPCLSWACCRRWTKRAVGNSVPLFLVFSVCSCNAGGVISGFNNAGKALADITEAAGAVLGTGANVSVSAMNNVMGAFAVASDAVDEIMHGVDVLNISVERHSCKVLAASPLALSEFIIIGADGGFDQIHSEWFAGIAKNLSRSVGQVRSSSDFFSVNGLYFRRWARARRRADSSAVAVLMVATVHFEVRWANPAWEIAGFRVDSESARIVTQLSEVIDKLPAWGDNEVAIDETSILKDFGAALGWVAYAPSSNVLTAGLFLAAMSFMIRHHLALRALASSWRASLWTSLVRARPVLFDLGTRWLDEFIIVPDADDLAYPLDHATADMDQSFEQAPST